jgi:DNA-binding NtrC family response regulator
MLDILLVDDEPAIRLGLGDALVAAGHKVTLAADGAQALEALSSQVFDLMVSDIHLPKASGMELFRYVREHAPSTDVILITAYGAIEDAVSALKNGARDYLLKPFNSDEVLIRVQRIEEQRALRKELYQARAELSGRGDDSGGLVGRSPPMVRLLDRIATMAASDAPVLITGESGTGKELVARRLHELSPRKKGPFVVVDCASFPETLIEAELFGHERGAFTGAVKRREGRFKAADGGTLFLDEVAEIPLPAQAKLLRVLQEGTIEPIGQNTPIRVDVRVLSATHRNLKRFIADERFREDLYYRLNVLDISIVPLRERRSDLPLLLRSFLQKLTPPGRDLPTLSTRAYSALLNHHFPGNVRELKHAIEHAVVLSRGGEIDVEHLPADIRGAATGDGISAPLPISPGQIRPLAQVVKECERDHLLRALDAAKGKKTAAAKLLKISRKNLWEKLRAHDITTSDVDD